MSLFTSLAACFSFLLALPATASYETNWTQYVNPFIGTEGTVPGTSFNGGNVFPGATVPFGAVKLGPDTTSFNASIGVNAGYTPDGNVTAFSLMHVSGTGGGPVYGVVSQMPLVTLEEVNMLDNITYMEPREGKDVAEVGYYKSTFKNGIVTEMSTTSHVGMLQYDFNNTAGASHILVDVSHFLPASGGGPQSQFYSNGEIKIDKHGQRYTGSGVYRGAFSGIPRYQIYFCGEFDVTPKSAELFSGPYTDPYWPGDMGVQATLKSGSRLTGGREGYDYGDRVGAVFSFGPRQRTVKSKVGVSWISAEKACRFIDDEMPHWDLDTVVTEARSTWNNDVFGKLAVKDLKNHTRLEMFYTAMYHAHLLPSDRTGENPHWESDEPYYDDYYTLWDTFRCLNSLYLLIQPERAIGMIRSLIDVWRHERFMPDGRSGNYNGQVQGGSNSDNVLADAFVKGLREGIDWDDAYAAMKTNAEVTPYNTFNPDDTTCSTKEGRGSLPDWLEYGFITPAYSRSISRTVEYALNDFSLAQVAKEIEPNDYQKYLNRSAGWQYLWQHDLESLNHTGFLAVRHANGSRDPNYDPAGCGACEGLDVAYEALPWEYSWTVPFDMETLIDFMGGPQHTEARLDTMFIPGLRKNGVGVGGLNGVGTTLFNPGNEPSFSTPLLYNYLQGRQYKSVLRSRQIVDEYYHTGPSGLPGNSDAGAIDSWLIWQMIGLYPVATQPVYLITSPWFDEITMTVGDGKKLRISTKGLGENKYYVQKLMVNGKEWDKSWICHEDIADGGTLEFELGQTPKQWDQGPLPPSPGHVSPVHE